MAFDPVRCSARSRRPSKAALPTCRRRPRCWRPARFRTLAPRRRRLLGPRRRRQWSRALARVAYRRPPAIFVAKSAAGREQVGPALHRLQPGLRGLPWRRTLAVISPFLYHPGVPDREEGRSPNRRRPRRLGPRDVLVVGGWPRRDGKRRPQQSARAHCLRLLERVGRLGGALAWLGGDCRSDGISWPCWITSRRRWPAARWPSSWTAHAVPRRSSRPAPTGFIFPRPPAATPAMDLPADGTRR